MKDNFDIFFEEILDVEGGYVNDPDDSGGHTNMGITFRTYAEYFANIHGVKSTIEDLKNMPVAEARAIYRKLYWDRVRADDLPSGIDILVADMAVNSGVTAASKMLQKVVDAKVDGVIGPNTLGKVEINTPEGLLHYVFMARRQEYHVISFYRNNQKFYKGWINRLNSVYDLAHSLIY